MSKMRSSLFSGGISNVQVRVAEDSGVSNVAASLGDVVLVGGLGGSVLCFGTHEEGK